MRGVNRAAFVSPPSLAGAGHACGFFIHESKGMTIMTRKNWIRRAATLALSLALAASAASAQMSAAAPIEAPAGTYALEKTHASLTWRIAHMGLSNYTARFKRFEATLRFDPDDFSRSSVEASVDIASIETDFVATGEADFNAELRSADFFNVGRFPHATFTSTKVTRTGPRSMRVDGNLALLGVTRPVSLDVVLNGSLKSHPFAKVPAVGFSGRGKVPRLAFGLNPAPIRQGVGEEADIIIEAEFLRIDR